MPFSFLIKDVKFLFQQIVIDHFIVQEQGHFKHLSSIGVHKIFKDNRDNVGQADVLIDDSTVGKAGQSQTFGVFQQAQLVDKMFFVDSTDLYNFTIFLLFLSIQYVLKEEGNQFEVSFLDSLVIIYGIHKSGGVLNAVQSFAM